MNTVALAGRGKGAQGGGPGDAVRLMLTRMAREKALPFEPLVPNAQTIASMNEARRAPLACVEALMADGPVSTGLRIRQGTNELSPTGRSR